MFEKFTERARKVMSLARQEAQRLNHECIGTEHILLGMVSEGGGVAAKVLQNMNVDLQKIRAEIERLISPGAPTVVNKIRLKIARLVSPVAPNVQLGQLPFSSRAKRVIELAQEAASYLGHDVIGTEHLLLGLLKEKEGIAAQVLMNLGLRLEDVREEVLEVLGADVSSAGDEQGAGPRATPPGGASARKVELTIDEILTRAFIIEMEFHIAKNDIDPAIRMLAWIASSPIPLLGRSGVQWCAALIEKLDRGTAQPILEALKTKRRDLYESIREHLAVFKDL